MVKKPAITVLMPMFNAARFLREAVDSILHQTFRDFEFLIIDDGSSDNSVSIIKSYDDPRIRLIVQSENKGISHTLNEGIRLSTSDVIARMDADDTSHPDRLQKQWEYMRLHPHCAMLSTWANVISADGSFIKLERYRSEYYYFNLTFECWIYHPTVMFRRSPVMAVDCYSMPYSEDYDLFWKLSTRFEIGNLQEALVDYRLSPTSLNTVLKRQEYDLANEQNVIRNIRYYLGSSYHISRIALACLRHDFLPVVNSGNLEGVREALQVMEMITREMLSRANPNRVDHAVREAAQHKRRFIISQLMQLLPMEKKVALMTDIGDWRLNASLLMHGVRWRAKKIKNSLQSLV